MKLGVSGLGIMLLALVIAGGVGGYYYYTNFLQENVDISKNSTSVPKYVDLTFSFGETGKLPTKYIDLRTNEFSFPISLRNDFDREVNANVCPGISLQIGDEYYEIKASCINFKISAGKSDGKTVAIPLSEEDKKKICNASKITLNISLENDGSLKSLAELDINQGFPFHQNSKTSALQINPIIQPNPINIEKDKQFSLSLSVKKFAEKLVITRIDVNPIETRIVTKKGTSQREEIIGIDGSFSLTDRHEVLLPDETINLRTLPAPYVKVVEGTSTTNVPLNCQSEAAQKLKLCEIQGQLSESFKKMYIGIEVFFSSTRHITEGLYIDKTQCTS